MLRTSLAFLAALALATMGAEAQTLYKLVDKNGKVTYVEKPPKDYDGKVIKLEIDPNANTATLPKPRDTQGEAPQKETEAEKVIRRKPPPNERLEAARKSLESARKAYAQARDNPQESDVSRMGNKGGGTRPVFSEEYQKRLAGLEQAVRDAEDELRKAEGGR